MKRLIFSKHIKYFVLGIALTLLCILFLGAVNSPPPPHYGRFQLQSWAAAPVDGGALVGAFVVDTATGETKTVYSRLIKSEKQSVIFTNQLKKPFSQIE
ncbi:hypothetical protein [uncultured Desulfobacter sp.]|uniref:hypothetical protein n=1 Tax=uncultured Desulfobacter sp. TaxID=240139 RepID=UPI0029F4ACF8|nr:hypothetical protein [uncultured Desulfobacter sp.]